MSTNLIDKMTEREAKALLNDICNTFGVGGKARTHSTILTNVENSSRRSHCLSEIECYLSVTDIDEEGEEYQESQLNWGESPDEYIKTFVAALNSRFNK